MSNNDFVAVSLFPDRLLVEFVSTEGFVAQNSLTTPVFYRS